MLLVMTFALATTVLVGYASYEFNALKQLNEQVNSAGRVRMLSQHAALLTHLAARGDVQAKTHLEETLGEFDMTLARLEDVHTQAVLSAADQARSRLNKEWRQLRAMIERLVQRQGRITDTEELQLATAASQTLVAAEDHVALYLPKVKVGESLMRALVPLSLLLGIGLVAAIVLFVRRRIFRPLVELESMMDRLAHGELSARGTSRRPDEIGRLIGHANHTAQTLEHNQHQQSVIWAQFRDSEIRHRTLWEISSEAIIIIDMANVITFANPAVMEVFGYQAQELIGLNISVLQPERLQQAHRQGMERYMGSGLRTVNWLHVDTQVVHKVGYEIEVELSFGEMKLSDERLLVGTFRDITERKRQQEALLRSANYDSLTGLPNRVLLHERIEQALSNARRHSLAFGVLYLDLDNFKIINETLGHESGDQLLCEASRRLLTCVRDGDTVARVGGDEFVLLLRVMQKNDDIDVVAQRALVALGKSFNLSGSEAFVGVSIGASVFPQDAANRSDLLQHADIAMYRAKDSGRNNYQRYDEQMQSRFKWRMAMEVQLRYAIEAGEFVLHYQPQIELSSGRVIGAEALVRWESPSLGRVSPAQFIPLAEETGLIVPIGKWVIQQACRDAARWIHSDEGQGCAVAINLSPRQFNEVDLFDTISQTLLDCEIAAHHVEFEITEGLVMTNPGHASEVLQKIRALGCAVALDDFGTGYSSLAYLRTFPIDCLKIDKSLINDVAIVRAVIQLARSFGFKTLAEGVEDEEVLVVLRDLGCDIVQGYFYARPMPLEAFQKFLLQTNGALQPSAL